MFTDADIAETKKEWDKTFLGAVLGAPPVLKVIQEYVQRVWKGHVPGVTLLPSGIFMMKFPKVEDLSWVLESGS